MSPPENRLDREFCAHAFIRAAQYFANMLVGADVLGECRDLVRSVFLPDFVCLSECAGDDVRCGDCVLDEAGVAIVRRAVRQVLESGFMAMETLGGESPTACVVLPVAVRGRTETAVVVGYRGEAALPSHALEALLGVVGLAGATLARQRSDRELLVLAEERAARAVAEVTERRARLLSDASKTLVASFDTEGTLSSLARLLVPQLGDWCAIELRDGERPEASRQVAWVHADPASAGGARERAVRGDAGAARGAEAVIATGEPELHPALPERFLAGWARGPEQLEAGAALGLASAMVVPMAGHGGVLGAIAIGAAARRYAGDDLVVAEEIGRRAGTAIENARLYLQAQQAIGVRDQFLAIASHELKTPLTALMLLIDTAEHALERLPHPPERMRSAIGVLTRQGHRLTQLVTNLLDVARIQAGRLHVSIEQVDLCAVVREVVERHGEQAARAGCDVDVTAPGVIAGAWDPSRVDQVVSNLVSNAIKYGAGTPVSLAAESDGATARLTVTDHGIGIGPEDHERIFQRFERAIPSGGAEGMGLGLWITREIVLRLGGSIRVESRLGNGARFTVELPMRRAAGDDDG